MKKILITGALGQIGSELTTHLRNIYGKDNVIASGRRIVEESTIVQSGSYELVDVLDPKQIDTVVKKYNIDSIIHLAAILSAVGESNPSAAWNININGLYNVLEVARENKCALFTPSSIAAFGKSSPLDNTPQDTVQRPETIYGVTKVSGELLCDYYHKKYGLDTRGVRYPGVISYETLPGGGTTDYAVHIYYEALKRRKYTCFIQEGTYMDMMYMPDVLNCVVNLMEADPSKLKHRNAFNVTSISCAPEDFCNSIKKYIPDFQMDYDIDPIRQAIAESWPNSMDCTAAKEEWGFSVKYNLDEMTKDMLEKLKMKLDIKA
ncbi:L-threonine 3-dehydrogenase [Clostridium sp. PL3]|uniref:L-threonine 3-dehydrogenase n=1 Tax=Clostridium thailandense TaxID=2794346 RepID=A0A949X4I5_9CLOT|nr:L-threonine 3-dehydrogenase [Clostridium thailandense]MBV7276559.1 L-threonine 3-dehydrogenase [Clostridium thailandense]